MQSSIAAEFVPQLSDRLRSYSPAYVYDQAIVFGGVEKHWDEAQVVKPPPAIPRIPIEKRPIIEIISEEPKVWIVGTLDGKSPPLVRIPPLFPSRFLSGNHSGYCKMLFDINVDGRPVNIRATTCTDEILRKSSVESLRKWRYEKAQSSPARSGVKTTIRYYLMDEMGTRLPLPEGF